MIQKIPVFQKTKISRISSFSDFRKTEIFRFSENEIFQIFRKLNFQDFQIFRIFRKWKLPNHQLSNFQTFWRHTIILKPNKRPEIHTIKQVIMFEQILTNIITSFNIQLLLIKQIKEDIQDINYILTINIIT